ncbi:MAG: DUF3710 domain-containing protein [Actinomycetales bacterium]
MFRRRRDKAEDQGVADPDVSLDTEGADVADDSTAAGGTDAERAAGAASREGGPYDADEVDDHLSRLDLGSMLLPGLEGMEVQLQSDPASGQVVAAFAVMGDSALQVQPFAAPRSAGIWDEVRAEIAAGMREQGGVVEEVAGRFGPELRVILPVQSPDGQQAFQPLRFFGVDGPRWFLRGVLSGRGAVEPEAGAPLEEVFANVVVVRGDSPMAPRDPLPLRLPEDAAAAMAQAEEGAAATDDGREPLAPFERGPEITEIR